MFVNAAASLDVRDNLLCYANPDALAAAGVDVTADRVLGLPHGFLRQLTVYPQAGRTVDHVAVWAAVVAAPGGGPDGVGA